MEERKKGGMERGWGEWEVWGVWEEEKSGMGEEQNGKIGRKG